MKRTMKWSKGVAETNAFEPLKKNNWQPSVPLDNTSLSLTFLAKYLPSTGLFPAKSGLGKTKAVGTSSNKF